MKQTKLIMGMPITIELVDKQATPAIIEDIFAYFRKVDEQFSPYKKTSEVSLFNKKKLNISLVSPEMKEVLTLAEQTKVETNGYFNVYYQGYFDPSGIVKGWAIKKAAALLKKKGMRNFCVDTGGDIQVSGKNREGKPWQVGIRNPFNRFENVKILRLTGEGIATSGTAIKGQHIYNPHKVNDLSQSIVSVTVIGNNRPVVK